MSNKWFLPVYHAVALLMGYCWGYLLVILIEAPWDKVGETMTLTTQETGITIVAVMVMNQLVMTGMYFILRRVMEDIAMRG